MVCLWLEPKSTEVWRPPVHIFTFSWDEFFPLQNKNGFGPFALIPLAIRISKPKDHDDGSEYNQIIMSEIIGRYRYHGG